MNWQANNWMVLQVTKICKFTSLQAEPQHSMNNFISIEYGIRIIQAGIHFQNHPIYSFFKLNNIK